MPSAGFSLGPGKRGDAAPARALKDMVRRHFALDEGASVFVAEVACGETDCPDVETIIAVFLDGARSEFKVPKAIAAIGPEDLRALAK